MDSAGNMQGKLSNSDVSDALSIYLKFHKSNPPLSEIFFYLQSTFLLDNRFDGIALYAIDHIGMGKPPR